jgi:hypothetical protein
VIFSLLNLCADNHVLQRSSVVAMELFQVNVCILTDILIHPFTPNFIFYVFLFILSCFVATATCYDLTVTTIAGSSQGILLAGTTTTPLGGLGQLFGLVDSFVGYGISTPSSSPSSSFSYPLLKTFKINRSCGFS